MSTIETAKIRDVLSVISPEDLPEIYAYLSSLLEQNIKQDSDFPLPGVLVNALLTMDKPREFSESLISFITELCEMEIAEGNSDAMNDLGSLYYEGSRGFNQSFEKAVKYYKLAADKGNRQAQENLGYCYYYGRDGESDYEKAFHYFALGAFDGHLVSLYKTGDMYRNGLYVPKNEKEAFLIYMRCIETMTGEAEGRVAGPVYLRLGDMFLNGTGTERNVRNAMVCYQKAEVFLCDMVLSGDVMYRKSLQAAVRGQEAVRKELEAAMLETQWAFD